MADAEELEYLEQLEKELENANKQSRKLSNAQLSLYNVENDNNLIKFQLSLEEEKDRIFHLLKGDRLKEDDKGNLVWEPPASPDSILLNDYGVDYIMGLLEAFLNRNIILSNFTEARIMEICSDLGMQISDDLYNDYEKMGLDTEEKQKQYPMLVLKVIFNIEAAYMRAMGGKERDSLRKVMSVTQNEPIMSNRMSQIPMVSQPRQPSKLLPWNWFGGR